MYCPSCGSEERQLSQFCRACGTDLRVVRSTLERPDSITASAVLAREQIGMAIADRIRQMESARDLKKVAEDMLPHFEKFLESPEEKRLRRIRAGIVTAAVGVGVTLIAVILALGKNDFIPFIGFGLITFLIGLGVVINGMLFTVPNKKLPGDAFDALSQKVLDSDSHYDAPPARASTNELSPSARPQAPSVTEHTTHHLNVNKP